MHVATLENHDQWKQPRQEFDHQEAPHKIARVPNSSNDKYVTLLWTPKFLIKEPQQSKKKTDYRKVQQSRRMEGKTKDRIHDDGAANTAASEK